MTEATALETLSEMSERIKRGREVARSYGIKLELGKIGAGIDGLEEIKEVMNRAKEKLLNPDINDGESITNPFTQNRTKFRG